MKSHIAITIIGEINPKLEIIYDFIAYRPNTTNIIAKLNPPMNLKAVLPVDEAK